MSQNVQYPPKLPEDAIADITKVAVDYALANSIIFRPLPQSTDAAPSLNSAIHGPFSLYPTPFPRTEFDKAVALQLAYNVLYANIANDPDFLESVIGGKVAKVDSFQDGLYQIWKQVQHEGVAQVRSSLHCTAFIA